MLLRGASAEPDSVDAGADAVVKLEDTEDVGHGRVVVKKAPVKGQWIRQAGCDIPEGTLVLPVPHCPRVPQSRAHDQVQVGHVLTAADIGLLATIGVCEVQVFQRPRVAVISTGNELVDPQHTGAVSALYCGGPERFKRITDLLFAHRRK